MIFGCDPFMENEFGENAFDGASNKMKNNLKRDYIYLQSSKWFGITKEEFEAKLALLKKETNQKIKTHYKAKKLKTFSEI